MTEGAVTEQADIRTYAAALWRRKWTVIISTVLIAAASFTRATLETPQYVAASTLLLRQSAAENFFAPTRGQAGDAERAVATEARVVTSQAVTQRVRSRLGNPASVSVRAIPDTDLLEIRSFGPDPVRVAETANAYAQAYVEFRRDSAVTDLDGAIRAVAEKIADLQTEIDTITAEINNTPPAARDEVAADRAGELSALRDSQALLRQTVDRFQLDAGLSTGGARIVAPASAPADPFSPNPERSLILGLAFGLLLGVVIALGRDWFDDTVRNAADLDRVMRGKPVLGFLPTTLAGRGGRRGAEHQLVPALTDPTSPAAEAYRTLRTSIQFLDLEHPLAVVAITSPASGEGKTSVAANLGVTLARGGKRVVLVSCDFRRPRLHEFFGLTNDVGFTSVLLGSSSLSAAVVGVPDEPNLIVLPSGPTPPNPAELLASNRTTEVLTSLRATADFVLLDCPPVVPVTDAAVLANRVDGVLVVATVRRTSRRQLSRALEILRQVDAPVIGSVLNRVEPEGPYTYVYVPHEELAKKPSISARI